MCEGIEKVMEVLVSGDGVKCEVVGTEKPERERERERYETSNFHLQNGPEIPVIYILQHKMKLGQLQLCAK